MHDCSEIKAKGELKSVRGSLSDSDFKKEKKTPQRNNKVVVVGCCTAKCSMVLDFPQTDSRRTATGLLGLLNICTLYPI